MWQRPSICSPWSAVRASKAPALAPNIPVGGCATALDPLWTSSGRLSYIHDDCLLDQRLCLKQLRYQHQYSYLAVAFFASEEVGSLFSPDLQFHVVTAKITRPCAFVSAKRPWPYRRRSTRETLSLLCSTNSERSSTTTMIGESGSSRSVHVQETISSAGQRHFGRLRTSLRS